MTTSSHIRTIGQQTTIFYSLNTFPVTYSQLNDLSTNRTKNGSSISRNKRMRIKERKKRNTRIQSTGKGLLNLINDGQEAIITLDMHKDEFELAVQRLHQSKARRIMNHFNRRTPPPFPSNVSKEMFYKLSKAMLLLQKTMTVENNRRNYGKNTSTTGSNEYLEHYSIEIIIKSRLPLWILDKVCQQKEDQEFWSVTRHRKFLHELLQRNEEVQRSQISSSGYRRKSTESKLNYDPCSTKGEMSALAAIKQPRPNDSPESESENDSPEKKKCPGNDKIRRPCSFCNEDHWNDECQVYQTAKQ
uniref:Uncharacterized protein n=1 Tax=Loa loa TaxID=7209 RepID=A0A1I7VIE6_LOALO